MCFEPSRVKFNARVTSVGESGKKNEKRGLIFHVFRQALPYGRLAQNFELRVRLVDVVNCAKFDRNRLRGFNSMSGQSLTIPIGLRCRC